MEIKDGRRVPTPTAPNRKASMKNASKPNATKPNAPKTPKQPGHVNTTKNALYSGKSYLIHHLNDLVNKQDNKQSDQTEDSKANFEKYNDLHHKQAEEIADQQSANVPIDELRSRQFSDQQSGTAPIDELRSQYFSDQQSGTAPIDDFRSRQFSDQQSGTVSNNDSMSHHLTDQLGGTVSTKSQQYSGFEDHRKMPPTDLSFSSTDSLELNDSTNSRQALRTPKSNLRSRTASCSSDKEKRRVKFNSSIEFNDGFIWMLKDNEQKPATVINPVNVMNIKQGMIQTSLLPGNDQHRAKPNQPAASVKEEKNNNNLVSPKSKTKTNGNLGNNALLAYSVPHCNDYSYPDSVDLSVKSAKEVKSKIDSSSRTDNGPRIARAGSPEGSSSSELSLSDSLEMISKKRQDFSVRANHWQAPVDAASDAGEGMEMPSSSINADTGRNDALLNRQQFGQDNSLLLNQEIQHDNAPASGARSNAIHKGNPSSEVYNFTSSAAADKFSAVKSPYNTGQHPQYNAGQHPQDSNNRHAEYLRNTGFDSQLPPASADGSSYRPDVDAHQTSSYRVTSNTAFEIPSREGYPPFEQAEIPTGYPSSSSDVRNTYSRQPENIPSSHRRDNFVHVKGNAYLPERPSLQQNQHQKNELYSNQTSARDFSRPEVYTNQPVKDSSMPLSYSSHVGASYPSVPLSYSDQTGAGNHMSMTSPHQSNHHNGLNHPAMVATSGLPSKETRSPVEYLQDYDGKMVTEGSIGPHGVMDHTAYLGPRSGASSSGHSVSGSGNVTRITTTIASNFGAAPGVYSNSGNRSLGGYSTSDRVTVPGSSDGNSYQHSAHHASNYGTVTSGYSNSNHSSGAKRTGNYGTILGHSTNQQNSAPYSADNNVPVPASYGSSNSEYGPYEGDRVTAPGERNNATNNGGNHVPVPGNREAKSHDNVSRVGNHVPAPYNTVSAVDLDHVIRKKSKSNPVRKFESEEDEDDDDIIKSIRKSMAELKFNSKWEPNSKEKAEPSRPEETRDEKDIPRPSNKAKIGHPDDLLDNEKEELRQQNKINAPVASKSHIPVRNLSATEKPRKRNGHTSPRRGLVPHPPPGPRGRLVPRKRVQGENVPKRSSPMKAVNPNIGKPPTPNRTQRDVNTNNHHTNSNINTQYNIYDNYDNYSGINHGSPYGNNDKSDSSYQNGDNRKGYYAAEIPLSDKIDKTPTDDEINELWYDVRNCLTSKPAHKASSDSVFISPPWRQHRTWSGSRNLNSKQAAYGTDFRPSKNSNSSTAGRLGSNLPLRRYGSYDNLRRENSLDNLAGNVQTRGRSAVSIQRSKGKITPSVQAFSLKNSSTAPAPLHSKFRPAVSKSKHEDSKFKFHFLNYLLIALDN